MKLTKTKLNQIIREELLKEGGTRGSLKDVRERFTYWFEDLIDAVNSDNFSNDDEGHSEAESITKEIKVFSKKLDTILKKYNQYEKLWFRRIL